MIKANLTTVKPTSLGVKGEVVITNHFKEMMTSKGIPAENVIAALRAPERVTPVRRYPGQKRYCGYGVAVVLDGDRAITLYLDQVVTPLRPDQLHDVKALNSIRASIPSLSSEEAKAILQKPREAQRMSHGGCYVGDGCYAIEWPDEWPTPNVGDLISSPTQSAWIQGYTDTYEVLGHERFPTKGYVKITTRKVDTD